MKYTFALLDKILDLVNAIPNTIKSDADKQATKQLLKAIEQDTQLFEQVIQEHKREVVEASLKGIVKDPAQTAKQLLGALETHAKDLRDIIMAFTAMLDDGYTDFEQLKDRSVHKLVSLSLHHDHLPQIAHFRKQALIEVETLRRLASKEEQVQEILTRTKSSE